ncbi:unnamed protein product [Amoebophrya sp. A25]|nr:unnamed protein product [Amoebophrya sp. A25]|eukprot:GSA25T00025250001.1
MKVPGIGTMNVEDETEGSSPTATREEQAQRFVPPAASSQNATSSTFCTALAALSDKNPRRSVVQPHDHNKLEVIELYPGDVFYFPSGMWHRVETVSDELSISINFSLQGERWCDLIANALRQVMARSALLRSKVVGCFTQQDFRRRAAANLGVAMDVLRDYVPHDSWSNSRLNDDGVDDVYEAFQRRLLPSNVMMAARYRKIDVVTYLKSLVARVSAYYGHLDEMPTKKHYFLNRGSKRIELKDLKAGNLGGEFDDVKLISWFAFSRVQSLVPGEDDPTGSVSSNLISAKSGTSTARSPPLLDEEELRDIFQAREKARLAAELAEEQQENAATAGPPASGGSSNAGSSSTIAHASRSRRRGAAAATQGSARSRAASLTQRGRKKKATSTSTMRTGRKSKTQSAGSKSKVSTKDPVLAELNDLVGDDFENERGPEEEEEDQDEDLLEEDDEDILGENKGKKTKKNERLVADEDTKSTSTKGNRTSTTPKPSVFVLHSNFHGDGPSLARTEFQLVFDAAWKDPLDDNDQVPMTRYEFAFLQFIFSYLSERQTMPHAEEPYFCPSEAVSAFLAYKMPKLIEEQYADEIDAVPLQYRTLRLHRMVLLITNLLLREGFLILYSETGAGVRWKKGAAAGSWDSKNSARRTADGSNSWHSRNWGGGRDPWDGSGHAADGHGGFYDWRNGNYPDNHSYSRRGGRERRRRQPNSFGDFTSSCSSDSSDDSASSSSFT